MSRGYRDRIRLMADVSADGAQVPSYETRMSGFPCHVMPKAAFESKRGRQIEASVSHVIEIRWCDCFSPDDVIENEETDARYSIKGLIDIDGTQRQMLIHCIEVVV